MIVRNIYKEVTRNLRHVDKTDVDMKAVVIDCISYIQRMEGTAHNDEYRSMTIEKFCKNIDITDYRRYHVI